MVEGVAEVVCPAAPTEFFNGCHTEQINSVALGWRSGVSSTDLKF